jgi:DNA-binding CsgD family transcriptional regulator
MLSDKSVLIERIHIAITKKWCHKSAAAYLHATDPASLNNSSDLIDKTYFNAQNAETIEKLSHRVEALENQNDQLLYFINFLVENFPDLIMKILHAELEVNNMSDQKAGDLPADNKSIKPIYYADKDLPHPTRREKDILDLLEKGLCAKEIANRLFISETTVITHKRNLKEKFNARNTVELISKIQSHPPVKSHA